VEHIQVAEPEQTDAPTLDEGVSLLVRSMTVRSVMLPAVHLDAELDCWTIEVKHVRANLILAPKTDA
jgi:hypothetical protein